MSEVKKPIEQDLLNAFDLVSENEPTQLNGELVGNEESEVDERVTETINGLMEVKTSLVQFNEFKVKFTELAKSAKGVDIKDFNDKQALVLVSTKRKELKKARTEVQNQGKAIRDKIRPMIDFVSEKEKELVSIVSVEEERLKEREKWAEGEIGRVKREEEEARKVKINGRLSVLLEFGFQVDYDALEVMTDEQFEVLKAEASKQFEIEQEQKREEERKRKEQEEALEQERKKLESERESMRKEIEEAKAEAERIKIENENRLREERAKADAEAKKAIDEANRLRAEMEAMKAEAQRKADEEKRLKEEAEAKRLAEEKAKQAEIERQKRLEALRPDKEKLSQYLADLTALQQPELSTSEGAELLKYITNMLGSIKTKLTQLG